MLGEDRRALGGAHAGHVDQVLDGHGKAVEVAGRRLVGRRVHEPPGMLSRPLEAQGGQRVDRPVNRADAGLGGVDELQRRDLAAFQQRHRLARGEFHKLVHGGRVCVQ